MPYEPWSIAISQEETVLRTSETFPIYCFWFQLGKINYEDMTQILAFSHLIKLPGAAAVN